MPDKTYAFPFQTVQRGTRAVDIQYRVLVDFAEPEVIATAIRDGDRQKQARIIGARLIWYWTGANRPDAPVEVPGEQAKQPHWEFDRYHSRVVLQRRTASAEQWGAPLTRTFELGGSTLEALEAIIVANAPTDEPVITWKHRDR